jgi:hypothetical protein
MTAHRTLTEVMNGTITKQLRESHAAFANLLAGMNAKEMDLVGLSNYDRALNALHILEDVAGMRRQREPHEDRHEVRTQG